MWIEPFPTGYSDNAGDNELIGFAHIYPENEGYLSRIVVPTGDRGFSLLFLNERIDGSTGNPLSLKTGRTVLSNRNH